MLYPERFSNLPAHAWPRLRALLDVPTQAAETINMTIGEPRHAFPDFVGDILATNVQGFAKYPNNNGTEDLLDAIAGFLNRRYGLDLGHDQILALNGTREGLYNAAMALSPEDKNGTPVILTPNPFYQVYAVAAHSVAAEPVYVPATTASNHLPDFQSLPADVLDRKVFVGPDLLQKREHFALVESVGVELDGFANGARIDDGAGGDHSDVVDVMRG